MTFPTIDLLMTFSVYSFFVFYLQKWTTIFKGASLTFETFLNFFMGIATIYGLGILVYYGYKVHWTAPITLFAMSFIIKGLMIWLEATLANIARIYYIVEYVGFIAIVACPILGFRLYHLVV